MSHSHWWFETHRLSPIEFHVERDSIFFSKVDRIFFSNWSVWTQSKLNFFNTRQRLLEDIGIMKLTVVMTITMLSNAVFAATPVPEPVNEAKWLHATCVGGGINGDPQSSSETKLSPCVNANGVNKVHWGFTSINQKQVSCRFGIDQCSEGLTPQTALLRLIEEFTCSNGKKHGAYKAKVIHKYKSQTIFGSQVEATYKNGMLEGESIHSVNGRNPCRTHQYKNGLVDGKSVRWLDYSTKKVGTETEFKAGLRHGTSSSYRKHGKTASQHYENGLLHGEALIFDLKGNVVRSSRYERGIEVSRTETSPDGKSTTKDQQTLESEKIRTHRQNEQQQQAIMISSRAGPPKQFMPLLGLSLGYLNDRKSETDSNNTKRIGGVTPGVQLFLGAIGCQDIACVGPLLSLGAARSLTSDRLLNYAEGGFGVMAMFFHAYIGTGVRRDGDRIGVQATAFAGFLFANIYLRGFSYVNEPGAGLEAGLQLFIPLAGI